ncbi:HAD family hydrolase [Nocardioides kongjuensis]|uniref:Putative hydrolase of the HAD superfamily n=1 Tax=Nocardioides kongjuensis TaxID=349522 RepID=A0A852RHV3_9ACTN|nr:HAD family hydrolase [Nocardioides kongjuensis]NYD32997.1 putative hydrolase of the HAD superfamily [Nocardioides kongjuensis]
MTFQALLLDLDDTLVDHRGASERGVRAWLSGLGLADSPAELETHVERWFVLEARHYERAQRGEVSYLEHRRARIRDFLPGWDLADDTLADDVYAGFLGCYRAAWRAFDDAAAAISRARAAGLPVGILTNGELPIQTEKLRRTGLLRSDVPVFASSALPAAKPDPRSYLTACASLGADPAATLMVGDSLRHDVVGAQRAGLQARLLDRHGRHDARRSGMRVRTVRSLAEVA